MTSEATPAAGLTDALPAPDVAELGCLDAATAETLKSYRQGDVLEGLTGVDVLGPEGKPVVVPAPLGVVLVAALTRLPGVRTDEEVRRFAGDVARKFGRFPFPDEVTPWLRPLETVVASKARKPNSPEGQALEQVVELRVEAPAGWGEPPFELTLCVIVQPDTLPTFAGDDIPALPDSLKDWVYNDEGELIRGSSDIAGRLVKAVDPAEKYWLWMALGDSWAARCSPGPDATEQVRTAVSYLGAEVVPADEFPLTRMRRSELLDLDHLCPPTPDLA